MDDRNVWHKLESNAYRNPEPYPDRPRKPHLAKDSTPEQVRDYADQLEAYETELKRFRNNVAAYNARSAALESQFRHDLEVCYHMVGHPKADRLYGKAWDMGHSAGLIEVAHAYSDLVELVL